MSDPINPSMLALAREAMGLSQTRLARLARLSQAHISKLEAGLVRASPEVVSAIAVAVKMPEQFFYQTDPVFGAGISEFFHRKRQSVSAKTMTQIHAQINITRIHISRLLRAVDLPECRIPALAVYDFRGGASDAARVVRSALNLPVGPIPNIVRVIEDAGGVVIPVAFGSYEVDAISRWVPGLPPLFFTNSSAPVDRFRMSLAHELAHMVLHRVPEPEMEDQAVEFAAEFLMPEKNIKNHLFGLTLDRLAGLKPHWRTSMAALLVRATKLQCVSPGSARYMWMNLAKRGYKKREPAELDLSPEPPNILREILEFYQGDLGYSVEDLAQLLAVSADDLMSLYQIALSKPETTKRLRLVK